MNNQTVLIFGGGVAGLSAAHELAERGFQVEVFEARGDLGGKARSQYVQGSGTRGRRDLPGEHGFRFFPSFYRHVIDTMGRIPDGVHTVVEHLRPATTAGVALSDGQPLARLVRRIPIHPSDLRETFSLAFERFGFSQTDSLRFTSRVLRYYTSCERRRLESYEKLTWWEFLEGDRYSPSFQRHLAAVPRMMVAMDARRGSARTIGDISMQLLYDYREKEEHIDRLLCGPTSEKWITPWRRHLERLGVRFHLGSAARAILVKQGRVSGVRLAGGRVVSGDHYLLAVPIEALRPLLNADLAALDPALMRLRSLDQVRFRSLTNWMNGIQFYLRRDVPLTRGHLLYPDAPWALTAISQQQFWQDDGPFETRYGDGSVRGLISVDISEWHERGRYVQKAAKDCTDEEVRREVWQQLLCAHKDCLHDEDLVAWHLDDELERRPHGGFVNRSPLLVHPPGSWHLRPEAKTRIPNLTLAADYVRTGTDIASMEGANEAARRAVNAILEESPRSAKPCRLFARKEPKIFERARKLDERLYQSRLFSGSHAFDLLWRSNVLENLL